MVIFLSFFCYFFVFFFDLGRGTPEQKSDGGKLFWGVEN